MDVQSAIGGVASCGAKSDHMGKSKMGKSNEKALDSICRKMTLAGWRKVLIPES